MGVILYQSDNLTVLKKQATEDRHTENEIFSLLRCATDNTNELIDFLSSYPSRYARETTILPNTKLKDIDCRKIKKLGLCASKSNKNVIISYDFVDKSGSKKEKPNVICVGSREIENARDAIKTVKLAAYLMFFSTGSITEANFKKRCNENNISFQVRKADNGFIFSISVPERYFASRNELSSDLLKFDNGMAIVEASDLLLADIGIPAYPQGQDLKQLAATVLAEKLVNESSTKRFYIDPIDQKLKKEKYTTLLAATVEMCMQEQIAPCPICGRIVLRPKNSSSRFNCGEKGHQTKYNKDAQKFMLKSGSIEKTKSKFPYINEKTIENWVSMGV